jgi:hypothetical protein
MLWFHVRAGVRVALVARCPQLEILDDLKYSNSMDSSMKSCFGPENLTYFRALDEHTK